MDRIQDILENQGYNDDWYKTDEQLKGLFYNRINDGEITEKEIMEQYREELKE